MTIRAVSIDVQTQLDVLPLTIVRLDGRGVITHVNEAWRQFARANGGDVATITGVGLDYLAAVRGVVADGAPPLAAGLADVIAGRRAAVTVDYPCHSTTETRWFRVQVHRVLDQDAVILVHTDQTERHLAEARLRLQTIVAEGLARAAPLHDTCCELMRAACEGHVWDVAALWMPGGAGRLRCGEVWARPDAGLAPLVEATRGQELEVAATSSLPGRTWRAGTALHLARLVPDDDPRCALAVAVGMRSSVAVPLGPAGEP